MADLMGLDFTPFHIFSAHGQRYCGIRPSMIPKPFKSVVVVLGKHTYKPGLPRGCVSNQILGYDAAIKVGINLGSSMKQSKDDTAYRIITLLKDGQKWSKLISPNGHVEENWI